MKTEFRLPHKVFCVWINLFFFGSWYHHHTFRASFLMMLSALLVLYSRILASISFTSVPSTKLKTVQKKRACLHQCLELQRHERHNATWRECIRITQNRRDKRQEQPRKHHKSIFRFELNDCWGSLSKKIRKSGGGEEEWEITHLCLHVVPSNHHIPVC